MDNNAKFDNCCQRYIATRGNFFKYKSTSTFLVLKYYGGIFFENISDIYTKWGAQTDTPIFGLFANFDSTFTKIVAPSSDENKISIVYLKAISLLKKMKTVKIDR